MNTAVAAFIQYFPSKPGGYFNRAGFLSEDRFTKERFTSSDLRLRMQDTLLYTSAVEWWISPWGNKPRSRC